MKPDSSSKKASDDQDLTGLLKQYLVKSVVYSAVTVLIYFCSGLSWWLGLILFIVFALFVVVPRLFLNGIVALVQIASLLISFALVRRRGMNLSRVDELKQPVGDLLKVNLLLIIFESYFVALALFLGLHFLFGWFSHF